MKKAYSYIRFSSAAQAEGHSLSRQLKATREYCKVNGLVLDESLSFRDLGVSAFKGANKKKGLGQFLDACESGLIEEGSALVVEALDRLSRQRPRVVVTLLGQLLDDYGLEVHLTGISKILKPQSSSAAEEGMDLIMTVAMAIRAADEQESKAIRLRAAFAEKLKLVEEGKAFWRTSSKQLPWWIEFDIKNQKLKAVPERAEVLKMIYRWAADGKSCNEITKLLNEKEIPVWKGRYKTWRPWRIQETLHAKAAEGIFAQNYRAMQTAKQYEFSGYYPVVVDPLLAIKARTALEKSRSRGRSHSGGVVEADRPINFLRGLVKANGHPCKFDIRRNGKDGAWNTYYMKYIRGETITTMLVTSGKILEPTLLAGLRELKPVDLLPLEDEKSSEELTLLRLKSELKRTQSSKARLVEALEEGAGSISSVVQRLRQLEIDEMELEKKLADLAPREKTNNRKHAKEVLMELKSLADADLTDNEVRRRLASVISRLISKIDYRDGLSKKSTGILLRSIVEGNSLSVADPVQPSAKRKAMYITVYFRAGGRRVIARLPDENLKNLGKSDRLITGRVND